ncbi:MAG: PAS domain S-box protein [Methanoregula sp.]|uniref:PAS domain S-box protein n=1 Tax=Methanoregula sp. TaxID=2052170 RepID=UPI0025DE2D4B|nr:PAS domain S-box protein [Methanoregula sp.]MCK9630357.1 PAS domain S-box protein [Methanoregula sp.]
MISVLYVDDEDALLDIGKRYLERTGKLKVDITTSVSHALELMSVTRYDVIVSDYQMPEMDGIEFLKKLRALFPKIPFIIFTGKGREEVAVEAFEYGADFYLQKGGAPKPQFTELARKIITAHEHRQGEFHIYKLNRLFSVLSATNKAIVRNYDVHDLLEEICRISVENGGFRMAWAGMVNGPANTIDPVASYGHTEGYLEHLTGSTDDARSAENPTETAVRTGKYEICDITPEDPLMYPWKAEAIRRGYHAIAAFPFAEGTRYAGALTLCAPETGFFDDQIISLLDEMARDLTFALKVREDDERRRRTETELQKKNHELAAAYEQLTAQEEELRANYDELKRGEDTLRQSEEKYRRIVETANEGIWMLDADFSTTFVNKKLAEFLGFTEREMLGKNIADFMRPDDTQDHLLRKMNRKCGKSEQYERRFIRKDGSTCWLLVSGSPLYDSAGNFSGSFAMVTNITNLKLAEEKLARNEKKFRHIFDAAPYLIISVNREGTIVDCNRRIENVLQYQKQEITGKPFASLVHADHRTAAQEYLRLVLTNGSSRNQMYGMLKKDGGQIDVSVSSSGLKDQSGALFRAVCIIEDITEHRKMQESLLRKNEDLAASFEELTAIEEELRHHHEDLLRSEEALRASETRYRNIFENAILGIYRTAPEGKIIEINPAFARILGYDSPEDLKSSVSTMRNLYVHPEDRDKIVMRIGRSEAVRAMDVECIRKDGRHIWLNLNARGIENARGEIIAIEGTTEDITDRCLAESGLKIAHAKLQLLSSITRHDILNQLNALRAYLDLMKDEESDPVKVELLTKEEKVVATIEEQILFTRDYQTMGMIAPSWQNVSMQLVKSTRGLTLRNVRIESSRSDLEVLADPLLTKVFYNLVDNSLRHGGDQLDLIRFSCQENGEEIICVYEDNGMGIPPKDKPLIFNRGFGKNTGLGMFLAKEILAITGMAIQETGEFGTGARFEITVPKDAYRFSGRPAELTTQKIKKDGDARSRIRTGEPLRD